jgi:hypothetical protein
MGMGPNYVLDKGHLATGSTAYTFGEIVVPIANPNSTESSVANACVRATSAGHLGPVQYVVQEDLDTVKLATGKAIVDCRMMGIARVLTGAAVNKLTKVTNDGTARAITQAQTAGGSQPVVILGIALTDASAAGQYIDVLLTPGVTF